ncbi:hypothetical protein APA_4497 [Pseudanabaena sp. lw0831]|nr:hypothetical protein APA_4497 [Pseudanabaena sp. lw0831]
MPVPSVMFSPTLAKEPELIIVNIPITTAAIGSTFLPLIYQ